MFAFLKRRRRKRLLAEPFPAAWDEFLAEDFHQFALLPEPLRAKLRDRMRVFEAEKYWEGLAGLEVTEPMRVVVSAMACLLTLAFEDPLASYQNVSRVIFQPNRVVRRGRQRRGVVLTEGDAAFLGQAWSERETLGTGVVSLVWNDVVAGGRNPNDGQNLVFHEFAHMVDMAGGIADGIPPVGDDDAERDWKDAFYAEFMELVDADNDGFAIPIDLYALTNEAEFFAVATENYLERPRLLRLRLPRVYGLLDSFYRLDPAEW